MSLTPEQVMAYWPSMMGAAKRLLPLADRTVWEDLAGDTVEKALRNQHRYTDRGNGPHAWLTTMATRIAIDYKRRRGNAPTLPLEDFRHGTEDAGSDRHVDLLDVRSALAQASDRDRAILESHHRDGVALINVECLKHYSKGNTSKHHGKALRRLRPALEVAS
jgi:DNA-directed RNA polymerase specialized sigma24 family protein